MRGSSLLLSVDSEQAHLCAESPSTDSRIRFGGENGGRQRDVVLQFTAVEEKSQSGDASQSSHGDGLRVLDLSAVPGDCIRVTS